jgi:hypothetical protein
MAVLPNGYDSCFIKLFSYEEGQGKYVGLPFNYVITNFKYTYNEEKDDEVEVSLNSDTTSIIDYKGFLEGSQLKVVWGYIVGGKCSRVFYVRDIEFSGDDNSVALVVKGTDKASSLKDSYSQEIHTAGTGNDEDTFDWLKVVTDFCKKHGLVLNLQGKNFSFRRDPVQAYIEDHKRHELDGKPRPADADYKFFNGMVNPVPGLETHDTQLAAQVYRYNFYPQANKSDLLLIKELLAKSGGGPWIATGRDNELKVAVRNLEGKPVKNYTYYGGNGELLSFNVASNSESIDSEADSIAVSNWDPENKTYNTQFLGIENKELPKLGENSRILNKWGEDLVKDGLKIIPGLITGIQLNRWLTKVAGMTIKGGRLATGIIGVLATEIVGQTLGEEVAKSGRDKIESNSLSNLLAWKNGGYISQDEYDRALRIYNNVPVLFPKTYDQIEKMVGQGVIEARKQKYPPQDVTQEELWAMLNGNKSFVSLERNPIAAKAEAENIVATENLKKIEISFTAIGDPHIKSESVVSLRNIGKKYSNNYWVTSVSHRIDMGGYYIEAEGFSNGQGVGGKDNKKVPGKVNIEVGPDAPDETTPTVVPSKRAQDPIDVINTVTPGSGNIIE